MAAIEKCMPMTSTHKTCYQSDRDFSQFVSNHPHQKNEKTTPQIWKVNEEIIKPPGHSLELLHLPFTSSISTYNYYFLKISYSSTWFQASLICYNLWNNLLQAHLLNAFQNFTKRSMFGISHNQCIPRYIDMNHFNASLACSCST